MPLKTAKSPFPAKVKDDAVTTWVKPALVAEVKFTEWTRGRNAASRILGLRGDKRAEDVVREREQSHRNMTGTAGQAIEAALQKRNTFPQQVDVTVSAPS